MSRNKTFGLTFKEMVEQLKQAIPTPQPDIIIVEGGRIVYTRPEGRVRFFKRIHLRDRAAHRRRPSH